MCTNNLVVRFSHATTYLQHLGKQIPAGGIHLKREENFSSTGCTENHLRHVGLDSRVPLRAYSEIIADMVRGVNAPHSGS